VPGGGESTWDTVSKTADRAATVANGVAATCTAIKAFGATAEAAGTCTTVFGAIAVAAGGVSAAHTCTEDALSEGCFSAAANTLFGVVMIEEGAPTVKVSKGTWTGMKAGWRGATSLARQTQSVARSSWNGVRNLFQ